MSSPSRAEATSQIDCKKRRDRGEGGFKDTAAKDIVQGDSDSLRTDERSENCKDEAERSSAKLLKHKNRRRLMLKNRGPLVAMEAV